MKKLLATLLAACCLTGATMLPAVRWSIPCAPDNPLFGRPTSDDTIYVTTGAPGQHRPQQERRLDPARLRLAHLLRSGQR